MRGHRAGGAIRTGSEHFDGEWALVANQMSATGLRAAILRHPASRERWLPALRAAGQRCLAPRSLFFARALWSGTFEEQADSPSGHAYIGDALLCALAWRQIDPAGSRAEHARIDRMARALARRFDESETGLFETFPSVTSPADVASCVAALAMADRAALTARCRGTMTRPISTIH